MPAGDATGRIIHVKGSHAGLTWPLSEQMRHFDLAHVLNSAVADSIAPERVGGIDVHHAGLWECDLADNSLIWSGGVFDLFGLDRSCRITREQALAHYSDESRTRLERVRGDAIRNRRGFTLEVEIRAAAVGQVRHLRLIGVPVYSGETPVRVHGLKLLI
jgi:hypothetical protein